MKRKILPVMAMAVAVVGSTIGANAAELVNPTAGEVPVTLTVEANYTVALPASIDLDYDTEGVVLGKPAFQADYDVKVEGTLPTGFDLEVTCDDVTLTGAADLAVQNGFGATSGNIGQKVAKVTAPETDGTINGHMETDANGVVNGTYTGTAEFTYKLVEKN